MAAVLLSRNADAQTTRELNTIADIYGAIRACWKAPNISDPLELAVRLSFTRDGKMLGKARFTYENKTVPVENRLRFRILVMDAFKRCTPSPFSPGLGDAVAGNLIFVSEAIRDQEPSPRGRLAMMSAFTPKGRLISDVAMSALCR
jgi:hypothetical protein